MKHGSLKLSNAGSDHWLLSIGPPPASFRYQYWYSKLVGIIFGELLSTKLTSAVAYCKEPPYGTQCHYVQYIEDCYTYVCCAGTHIDFHYTPWLTDANELTSVAFQVTQSEEAQKPLGNAPHPTRGLSDASKSPMNCINTQ